MSMKKYLIRDHPPRERLEEIPHPPARQVLENVLDDALEDLLLARLVREKGNGLVLFGSPNGCLEDRDPVAGIEDFERQWGTVLLNALRRFRLRELRIVTDRDCYRITPWDLLKIWRKPSPLSKADYA